jgi:hypothetical protein
LAVRGIGFAPETIAPFAICRVFVFRRKLSMTAYLLSLAIIGLVALAICDALG